MRHHFYHSPFGPVARAAPLYSAACTSIEPTFSTYKLLFTFHGLFVLSVLIALRKFYLERVREIQTASRICQMVITRVGAVLFKKQSNNDGVAIKTACDDVNYKHSPFHLPHAVDGGCAASRPVTVTAPHHSPPHKSALA